MSDDLHPNFLRSHLARADREEPEEESIDLPLLKFHYVNWRGMDHEYVIEPEGIECGPYDSGGRHHGSPYHWVLHGLVVTRDGDGREDMGTRRRTFELHKIRDIREAERDA